MKSLYMWVNLLSVLPPLVLSFHPKLQFHKRWQSLLPGIFIAAFVFILFDIWYTSMGVWGFSDQYTLGIRFFMLPIEEILFFLCIPYACLFSYHCLNTLVPKNYIRETQTSISIALLILCLILSAIYHQYYYTLFAFASAFILILLLQYIVRVTWLHRFYFAYFWLLLPFLIVNGILTGTGLSEPVVWYNEDHIMGPRLLTIPLEDIFYGMSMLLLSTSIYEYLWAKQKSILP